MKKIFLLSIALFTLHTGFTQVTVPNGNLENWHKVTVSASLNYDQPGVDENDNWITTLNDLMTIPAPIGPGPVTVFKSTDAHTGNYAAKLVSGKLTFIPNDIFIPGMLGTCKMLMTSNKALLGRGCVDCKPTKFSGYFKSSPVNGDSVCAVILVSKWNAATKHRDTIGYGAQYFKGEVATYQKFEVPVTYYNSEASDSITLLCVSSGGFNAVKFTEAKGQVGSTMYVDDLVVENASGIQQSLMPEVGVTTYPNPATEEMHVDLTKALKNGSFEVYNVQGKLVAVHMLSQIKNTVSVRNMTPGTYYFRVLEGTSLYNTGSFIVQR